MERTIPDRLAPLWKLILLIFVPLMLWAGWESLQAYGIAGMWVHAYETAKADPIIAYSMLDLCGGFALVFGWILWDCRRRGIRFWLWLPALIFLGTVGVMAYFLYARTKPAVEA